MAIRSSFFNSVNGDRRYLAYNFAEYFASFIGNGVFANPSNAFQVYEKENMIVNVKAGKAWINGYIAVNDGDYNLTITNADGVLNRIDRIVLRLDFNVRAINIAVKKGAFASTPVAPTLQRDAEVYELVLADVYVGKGITRITQSNITDQRMNKALCGVVKGTVDQIDTTDLFNQYGSAFQEWFETVKNYLNDTAVGNVANKLAEHELNKGAHGLGIADLNTTAKTIREAINEVFTSGNNVKKNVVDTLLSLDNTLPINTNSPWDKITESLPNVSGKSPMNVFIQPTEPVKKEGIWFKTAESNKPDVEDYKYDPKVNSMDTTLTTLTPPLANDGSLHFYNNEVYHIYSNENTFMVSMYSIKLNIWKTFYSKTLNSGVWGDAGQLGGKVYKNYGSRKVLEYDFQTNAIKEIPMPAEWEGITSITATDSKLFGVKETFSSSVGYESFLVIFNISNRSVKESKVTTRLRSIYGIDDKIFGLNVYNEVYEFDINTNIWSTTGFTAHESKNYNGNMIIPVTKYDIISIGGYYRYDNSYSFTYAYNTLTQVKTVSNYLQSKTTPIMCKDDQNHIYCITKNPSSDSLQFSRLTYNNQIIKGVNIDNSVIDSTTQYKTALSSLKPYKSIIRLENNFVFAYISKDGITKLRDIPTYYGDGTKWTLANSIK
ncbi:hypothetical protein AB0X74_05155 [Kurthia gibsonii]|uniref:hypothetical protein n=1 Tax=Kurthia gibsonii TaxID=33946 RepID=UPI003F24867E